MSSDNTTQRNSEKNEGCLWKCDTPVSCNSVCKQLEMYGDTWYQMSFLRPGVIKQHQTFLIICIISWSSVLCVCRKLYGDQARYFDAEMKPKIKHKKRGLISMVDNGHHQHGSQVIGVHICIQYLFTKEALPVLQCIPNTYCLLGKQWYKVCHHSLVRRWKGLSG